jgi:hypothetical protein
MVGNFTRGGEPHARPLCGHVFQNEFELMGTVGLPHQKGVQ